MPSYLTTANVKLMHHVLIERYGGLHGVRDEGLLEAAIFRPQSGYYQNIFLQAAALFESLIINHPFVDGNKRIAFAATDVFLRVNGYRLVTSSNDAYSKITELLERKEMNIENINLWLKIICKEI